jgi:prepilin-type N-terminal cleavage/methylation domain-containing protein
MKKSAFSLVELSVVIAIVGFLIAGVAQASKMIRRSALVAAQSQTKQSVVKDMSGLVLWYETTLDSSFIPEEAMNGGGVKTWYDNNSQALSRSKAYTTMASPLTIYSENAINGLPALRCNSSQLQVETNTEYRPNNGIPIATNSFTIFLVANSNVTHQIDGESNYNIMGTSGQTYVIGATHSGGSVASDTVAGAGISLGTNGVSVYEHANSYMPALAVYDGSTSKLLTRPAVIAVDYNNKTPTIFINSNTSRVGLTSSKTTVAAPLDFCSGAYGAFDGYIGEVIIFNRHLLTDERKAVEKYLGKKWKIDFQ